MDQRLTCYEYFRLLKLFTRMKRLFSFLATLAVCGIAPPTSSLAAESIESHGADVPAQLLERKGDKIVDAPAEDFALAKTYHLFKDKGTLVAGQRITIMTAKTQHKVGEPVRVLHILESVKPGIKVYVMGPKTIYDEYVDGRLSTRKGPGNEGYDGMVIDRPMADFNYDITTYTFSEPGQHTIQWKGGGHPTQGALGLESNIIELQIIKE
jgi:hypothetical protein